MDLRKEFKKQTGTKLPMTRTMEAYATYYRLYAEWLEERIIKLFAIPDVVEQSKQLVCDVCGSGDVVEAPHMGKNCNRCHPL